MVFNSLTFLVFFGIVLGIYRLPLPWTWRKLHLLLASYLFYAAWNPPFVLLLILAAVVDYHLAHWMSRQNRPAIRLAILTFSIVLNLGLLSYFKYGQFLLDNFVALAGSVGIHYRPPTFSIVLLLGISFYTFETISYLVDVYRGRIRAWNSFLDYALFLTFFPHLVAGPIVRAPDFLPQCATPRNASADQLGWGLCLMVFGLFEKVILADALLAPVVDQVYAAADAVSFREAWLGTFAFAGQIFFDFAGYSTCGIGAALTLGFVLGDNFHCPYGAIGFSDFWRRWHISLSTWLRDYLYIPLGGNRHGPARTHANLMITMLLGGLWHGAAWRFIAWGGLHGSYLIAERVVRRFTDPRPALNTPLTRLAGALLTFALVCITYVFFRADDFATAFTLLKTMALPSIRGAMLSYESTLTALIVVALMLTAHYRWRDTTLEDLVSRMHPRTRAAALTVLLICLILAPGDDRAFIYFQF